MLNAIRDFCSVKKIFFCLLVGLMLILKGRVELQVMKIFLLGLQEKFQVVEGRVRLMFVYN